MRSAKWLFDRTKGLFPYAALPSVLIVAFPPGWIHGAFPVSARCLALHGTQAGDTAIVPPFPGSGPGAPCGPHRT
ncbi:hypothetical protein GCM10010353_26950 [Streptomyces chryseus]|uniref:Uncharacterized protein n=1 Tax=Streptomyces chryseus TaxID=68186 RepID=A0ABQ3DJ94_9ACTN|nr:hypothetical protein GCM10010353_26950 [Streptomyces chryseus]GHB01034.1 hypothetical protein GCM10010346_24780 [Streptomyces chryseus]